MLFDIASYGRGGVARRDHLSPGEIAFISRTVYRIPEVMVKVTSGGGASTARGVVAHFGYIGRGGNLEIETDEGEWLSGHAGQQLIEDWDLDMEAARKRSNLVAIDRRKAPKLVHRAIFSMPAGTPPKKVLAAVHGFARKEFGRKHRYAMVLHTDEPHPHVHLVVKAVSEDGVRLNIDRARLQHWREEFAEQLRVRGVEANATNRSVRGRSRTTKRDSIFRAARRGESSHMRKRVDEVVRELAAGTLDQSGAARLQRTRLEIVRGWRAVEGALAAQGMHQLADQVSKFVSQMPPPRTEKQWLAADLIERVRERRRAKDKPFVR